MVQEQWQQWLGTASMLRQAGRVDEAIAAYQRVLAIKPDLPDSWYNLGWLQKQARQFEEALNSYGRALALGIGQPEEVRLNRAVILSDHLQLPEEARAELEAALGANPRYVPALVNLGNLLEDLGDRAGAREAYERAVTIEPNDTLALARLAGVSHGSTDETLVARLRSAIAAPATAPAERADLGFALAALLDSTARYEDAFPTVEAANDASRAATGARYHRAPVERFVDRSIATFDKPVSPSNDPSAPLFILGMFRSGSTLTEQMLGRHSHIRAGGEIDAIPALVQRIGGYPEAVAVANSEQIEDWRRTYQQGLPPIIGGPDVLTDKRPDNFLHVGLIKTLFPGAKIVHTHRNPLDNLLSLYFLHLNPGMSYALDLDDAAHWYGQYRRLMAHWQRLYPGDIIDVDYDRLVRDPRSEIEPVLAAVGLQWEDGMLDFHRESTPVKTASVWQVRQPLHGRSSGRWRNYERQLMRSPGLRALADSQT